MKKKIIFAVGAVLVAAAVSAFVYVNNGRNSMDDLFNANVEALARNESGGCGHCYNGGPGSTSCSISAGVDVGLGISAGCSVSCGGGYYSCCSLRCICCQ